MTEYIKEKYSANTLPELRSAYEMVISDLGDDQDVSFVNRVTPVPLVEDNEIYGLFYLKDLRDNFEFAYTSIIAARGVQSYISMPSPSDFDLSTKAGRRAFSSAIAPFRGDINKIKINFQKPSTYDKEELDNLQVSWFFEATRDEPEMSDYDAYCLLYESNQTLSRDILLESVIASIVSNTVLLSKEGDFISNAFEYVYLTTRSNTRIKILNPHSSIREFIKAPKNELDSKQEAALRSIGIEPKGRTRRLTLPIEQAVLWGLNFLTAFPQYADHFAAVTEYVVNVLSSNENKDFELWYPKPIKIGEDIKPKEFFRS